MMNTSVAKSFAFPARNRLDVAEREAHHARNAELEAALTERGSDVTSRSSADAGLRMLTELDVDIVLRSS